MPCVPKGFSGFSVAYICFMKILITGANGFLGYYIAEQLLAKKYSVIATGKGECRLPFTNDLNFQWITMDFTDPFSIHDVFETIKPDVVVHSGAISKPDECETDQMKAYLVNVEGTVQLLINSEDLKSFTVKFEECPCDVFIPSAFTPNNDGLNDNFRPITKCAAKNYQFKIFNRYGSMIFTTTELNRGWNGKYKNSDQATGVFVWILQYRNPNNNHLTIKQGTVTLIR